MRTMCRCRCRSSPSLLVPFLGSGCLCFGQQFLLLLLSLLFPGVGIIAVADAGSLLILFLLLLYLRLCWWGGVFPFLVAVRRSKCVFCRSASYLGMLFPRRL